MNCLFLNFNLRVLKYYLTVCCCCLLACFVLSFGLSQKEEEVEEKL